MGFLARLRAKEEPERRAGGLAEDARAMRAARVEGFIELSQMMDAPGAAAGLPPDMIPRVHTKTLLLAWAFDETYGYLSALGRGA